MILTLNEKHELNGRGYLLGVDNENISETITVNIEYEALLNKNAYLEFKKGSNTYTTSRLNIVNGSFSYTLPNGLLQKGSVSVQAIFTDNNNFVWKSAIREFTVIEAINASEQLPTQYPSFISDAQEILDEAVASEAARVLAEQTRSTNETTRQSNETARVAAETTRGNNETTRQNSESARVLAENGRVAAEQARVTEFSGLVSSIEAFDPRLINLEEAGKITLYNNQEDTVTAYNKTVPTAALPYARVNKVGGMSYLSKNLYFNNDIRATQQARITLTKPLKAGTYTMSALVTSSDTDNSRSLVNVYDANNNIIASLYFNRNNRSSAKFTIATEATVLYFYASLSSVESLGDTFSYENIQIELGEVATYYVAAYEGFRDTPVTSVVSDSTLTINAAIRALDGYGKGINENLYNYIDYDNKKFIKKTRELTVTSNMVTGISTVYDNIVYYAFNKPNDFKGNGTFEGVFNCDKYTADLRFVDWTSANNIGKIFSTATAYTFWVGFPKGTTLEQAQAALNGSKVIYELTTQVETDISQYIDNNYIKVNGSVTFTNTNNQAAPNKITYSLNSKGYEMLADGTLNLIIKVIDE